MSVTRDRLALLTIVLVAACGGNDRSVFQLPQNAKPDDPQYSCAGRCGAMAPGGCWCDDECMTFGDCCPTASQCICAQVSPPSPTFCGNASIAPRYEGICIVGYECLDCAKLAPPGPGFCPNGKVVPVYDVRQCIVSYTCELSCDPKAEPQCIDACDGDIVYPAECGPKGWLCPATAIDASTCPPGICPGISRPTCAQGCGSDALLVPECKNGTWACPAGSVDTSTCPPGTCWGVPPLCCVKGSVVTAACVSGQFTCPEGGSFGGCA